MSLHLYDTRCEICGGTKELRPTYPGSKKLHVVCKSCGLVSDNRPSDYEKISGDWVGQCTLGVRF